MTHRSPWPVWLLALAVLAVVLAAARCWAPVIGPSAPVTPTPTIAVVVTDPTPRTAPSPTIAPTAVPTERLPMATATSRPSTSTPEPIATSTPSRNPTQKG